MDKYNTWESFKVAMVTEKNTVTRETPIKYVIKKLFKKLKWLVLEMIEFAHYVPEFLRQ